MPSKNSRIPSKSLSEPTFIITFRILLAIAVIQFVAAGVILAPRLIGTVAGQLASRSKTPELAPSISNLSPATLVASSDKSVTLSQGEKKSSQASEPLHQAVLKGPDDNKLTVSSSVNDVGFQPGASLAIIDVQHFEGSEGEQVLKIPIKSRPREMISVPDVKVQVYFYDQQDGEIVTSKSQVSSRWLSPPVDWKDADPELLEVTYQPDTTTPESHYVGYVVAVYYKGELQGYRANPVKLVKQFPVKIYAGSHD